MVPRRWVFRQRGTRPPLALRLHVADKESHSLVQIIVNHESRACAIPRQSNCDRDCSIFFASSRLLWLSVSTSREQNDSSLLFIRAKRCPFVATIITIKAAIRSNLRIAMLFFNNAYVLMRSSFRRNRLSWQSRARWFFSSYSALYAKSPSLFRRQPHCSHSRTRRTQYPLI